jgi:hypoxanthine phosphoribosyltransferase
MLQIHQKDLRLNEDVKGYIGTDVAKSSVIRYSDPQKIMFYLNADTPATLAHRLARTVVTNYNPNVLIPLWRGGISPGGVTVAEHIKKMREKKRQAKETKKDVPETRYCLISADSQYGPDGSKETKFCGEEKVREIIEAVKKSGQDVLPEYLNRWLIVDDLHDTGKSSHGMKKIIIKMCDELGIKYPEIKIATIYHKPEKNEQKDNSGNIISQPDFFCKELYIPKGFNDIYIVFSHELDIHPEEIAQIEDPLIRSYWTQVLEELKGADYIQQPIQPINSEHP